MNKGREAYLTLEFAVGLVVIAVPLLLGLSEVYRVEHFARKMIFEGQRKCMERAVSENGTPHNISLLLSRDVELLTFTKRYFGEDWTPASQHLERNYYIYTGTGKKGDQ